jgi:UDP-N-acetylmuramoyl-L-alanyl-D-glutamate--2,6-diaminopimelate ligase
MKNLREILQNVQVLESQGSFDMPVSGLEMNSLRVKEGNLFAAMKGTQVDGHKYIPDAIKSGASVILCEKFPAEKDKTVSWIRVKNVPEALGDAASSFFDHPSKQLQLIGVTGTNGKTSIATFLYHVFEEAGYPSGLISTIKTIVHKQDFEATHTTPDVITLNKLLHGMVKSGCPFVFMEVSSHAIDQKRIAGLHYRGGIFTNLTHDHLDYHKTFKNYLAAKKKFFDELPSEAFALINTDDKNSRVMVQNCKARVQTYGLKQTADFKGRILERTFEGTEVKIGPEDVWVPFIGDFNISNLLAVYAAAVLIGLNQQEVLKIISRLQPVPGRFETLRSVKGKVAIVDYAHTPDALLNVLKTIQQLRKSNSRIITVVGAGGDRDKTKRPEMAAIGAEISDRLILTSDNPRSENPEEIIQDMKKGIPAEKGNRVISIVNRKEAIRTACLMAEADDIILIAGKGHETYQEIQGVKQHFDDKEIVKEIFNEE